MCDLTLSTVRSSQVRILSGRAGAHRRPQGRRPRRPHWSQVCVQRPRGRCRTRADSPQRLQRTADRHAGGRPGRGGREFVGLSGRLDRPRQSSTSWVATLDPNRPKGTLPVFGGGGKTRVSDLSVHDGTGLRHRFGDVNLNRHMPLAPSKDAQRLGLGTASRSSPGLGWLPFSTCGHSWSLARVVVGSSRPERACRGIDRFPGMRREDVTHVQIFQVGVSAASPQTLTHTG
jgi:hypothetical protein